MPCDRFPWATSVAGQNQIQALQQSDLSVGAPSVSIHNTSLDSGEVVLHLSDASRGLVEALWVRRKAAFVKSTRDCGAAPGEGRTGSRALKRSVQSKYGCRIRRKSGLANVRGNEARLRRATQSISKPRSVRAAPYCCPKARMNKRRRGLSCPRINSRTYRACGG